MEGLDDTEMIEVAGELDYFSAYICFRELDKSVDIKESMENKVDMSPTIEWQRPCMGVAVCLSINQGELLEEYKGVEVGSRKRGGTSVESLIPCSHGGRALVVKGVEEVENVETTLINSGLAIRMEKMKEVKRPPL
ncbi:hypothetical protein BHE74_00051377 [Ensete ventricosum]|nr:hypothetical protein BHE74_00051377 [Ensete ventricosum]